MRLGRTLSRLGPRKPQLGALQGWGVFGGLEEPRGETLDASVTADVGSLWKLAANSGKQNAAAKWSEGSHFAPMGERVCSSLNAMIKEIWSNMKSIGWGKRRVFGIGKRWEEQQRQAPAVSGRRQT